MLRRVDTFQITTLKVVVSDPCYEQDNGCNITLDGVKNGEWQGIVDYENRMINALVAIHKNYRNQIPNWVQEQGEIGVDSGQAGIFDQSVFRNDESIVEEATFLPDEPWYSVCCQKTLGSMLSGVIPGGIVSSSGYGDGGYPLFTWRVDDLIVGIRIEFIGK